MGSMGCRVWGVGCGVWSVECGVWGVGCGADGRLAAFHVKHVLGGLDLAAWHTLVGIVGDGIGDVRVAAVAPADGAGVFASGPDGGEEAAVSADDVGVEGIVEGVHGGVGVCGWW